MDNFDELMGLAEVCAGPITDELYRRLLQRNYAQYDPEVVMLTAALTNIQCMITEGTAPRKSC